MQKNTVIYIFIIIIVSFVVGYRSGCQSAGSRVTIAERDRYRQIAAENNRIKNQLENARETIRKLSKNYAEIEAEYNNLRETIANSIADTGEIAETIEKIRERNQQAIDLLR
jgi:septal ring factor EnvC (AmiA/AmiB activator)